MALRRSTRKRKNRDGGAAEAKAEAKAEAVEKKQRQDEEEEQEEEEDLMVANVDRDEESEDGEESEMEEQHQQDDDDGGDDDDGSESSELEDSEASDEDGNDSDANRKSDSTNQHEPDDGDAQDAEEEAEAARRIRRNTIANKKKLMLQRRRELREKKQNLAELSDSEDEEGPLIRTGDVPAEWYDEYDHIGYDIQGKKVMRSDRGDGMDEFLSRTDDPNRFRTVYDAENDRKVVLTDEEMRIIRNLRRGRVAHSDFNPEDPKYILDEGERRIEPLPAATEPKRRFVPSKWEEKKIVKLVNAIRNGWVRDPAREREARKPKTYLMWDASNDAAAQARAKGLPPAIPPPKSKPPGHAESYNPPEEYLPTAEEIEAWEQLDPSDRPFDFIPTKYSSMREVPAYQDFIKERFERCLDLYLCPRTRKKRLDIDPESLIPKLPKPTELRPFPTTLAIEFVGHQEKIRSISVSPDGQWMASGSDDKTVRVWETDSGRCFRTFEFDEIVDAVAWSPDTTAPLLAVASGTQIVVMHTQTGNDEATQSAEERLLSGDGKNRSASGAAAAAAAKLAQWSTMRVESDELYSRPASRVVIDTGKRMKSINWHPKGDYLATVASTQATAKSVLVHRLSHRLTMAPFTKSKGLVQRVAFHPAKPIFFVATQRHIRVYNLVQQQLLKKMQCPAKWISSMSIHPGGDNLIVGSYDRKVCWYDLDLGARPYRTLKYHDKAVRGVHFHPTYPLFVSCSDDGNLHVFHGRVYNDLLTNPLIVPVKIIKAHKVVQDLGVLDCVFHPTQPYVFSAGADRTVRLFTT